MHWLVQGTIKSRRQFCSIGARDECGICFNAVPEGVFLLAGPLDAQANAGTDGKKKEERVWYGRLCGNRQKKSSRNRCKLLQTKDKKENVDQLVGAIETNEEEIECQCRRILGQSGSKSQGDAAKVGGRCGHGGGWGAIFINRLTFTNGGKHFSLFFSNAGQAAIGVRSTIRKLLKSRRSRQRHRQHLHSIRDCIVHPSVEMRSERCGSRQAVVAFTMKDWRALV
jgi:hypothetical protein